MASIKPAPSHASFTHANHRWDVTVSLYCGVYRAIIECEGVEVERRVIAPVREMSVVVGDVIVDIFGEHYGMK